MILSTTVPDSPFLSASTGYGVDVPLTSTRVGVGLCDHGGRRGRGWRRRRRAWRRRRRRRPGFVDADHARRAILVVGCGRIAGFIRRHRHRQRFEHLSARAGDRRVGAVEIVVVAMARPQQQEQQQAGGEGEGDDQPAAAREPQARAARRGAFAGVSGIGAGDSGKPDSGTAVAVQPASGPSRR